MNKAKKGKCQHPERTETPAAAKTHTQVQPGAIFKGDHRRSNDHR